MGWGKGFGEDVRHGGLLLLAGIFLVTKGEQFRFSVPAIFGARFMVRCMGIFATFAGFIRSETASRIKILVFGESGESAHGAVGFETYARTIVQ